MANPSSLCPRLRALPVKHINRLDLILHNTNGGIQAGTTHEAVRSIPSVVGEHLGILGDEEMDRRRHQ